jgi:hypothetical protein
VRDKVNGGWVRRARLGLASWVAPAGAEVRDPQAMLCNCWEWLLELVQFDRLRVGTDGGPAAPVGGVLDEMYLLGAVEHDAAGRWRLTSWGMLELARMWGPDVVPPWGGVWLVCAEHWTCADGPGEPLNCPECPPERTTGTARPWWSWMMLGRMSRYRL